MGKNATYTIRIHPNAPHYGGVVAPRIDVKVTVPFGTLTTERVREELEKVAGPFSYRCYVPDEVYGPRGGRLHDHSIYGINPMWTEGPFDVRVPEVAAAVAAEAEFTARMAVLNYCAASPTKVHTDEHTLLGNCWHRYTCTSCGRVNEVDSSG